MPDFLSLVSGIVPMGLLGKNIAPELSLSGTTNELAAD
jgi:hypothetical protein